MYWIVCLTAALVFAADYIIKGFLRINFAYQSIPIIKNILHLTVIFNKGAAFGILKGTNNFLIYIGIIFIIVFLAVIQKEKRKDTLFLISAGLILGGALSNLYDRIFLGYVVDYIDIRIWPVFNLSDSCITIGVGLLLIDALRRKSHGKRDNHPSQCKGNAA